MEAETVTVAARVFTPVAFAEGDTNDVFVFDLNGE